MVKYSNKRPQKISLERQLLLLIIFIAISFLGFRIGVLYSVRKTLFVPPVFSPYSKSASTIQPKTMLSVSPRVKSVSVGETFPLSVRIDKQSVQAVDVVLNYDPAVFAVTDLRHGKLFPLFLREQIEEGRIAVSASVTPQNPHATGSGEIFTVLFTAVSATPSSIVSFDRQETITARNGNDSLGEVVGGKYTVE